MGTAQLDSERASFDKWQMHKLIRDENIGPCSIPKTNRLTARNLKRYLEKFERVYVKPTGTWGGADISVIEHDDTSIVWTMQGEPGTASNLEEILHHYDGVPAIVQQAIPALLHDGCPFDIRVHMQRDADEEWVYAGELVRIGGQGIVSNVEISNGRVLPLSSVLHELFPEPVDVEALRTRLTEIGHSICDLLDTYSHIEEVGIDLAIDASAGLWLIEVNTNDALGAPSYELFRYLPDQHVYHEILQRASSRQLNTLQLLFDMLTQDQTDNT